MPAENTPEEVEDLLRVIDELERINNAVKEISTEIGSDSRVSRTVDENIRKLRESVKSKIN
jgi:antitoxin component HigA of HigAB toxin-antitoxin module